MEPTTTSKYFLPLKIDYCQIHGQGARSQKVCLLYAKLFHQFPVYDISQYAHLLFYRMQPYPAKNVLPSSSTHALRKTHNKYMEAIADMKNATKSSTWVTLKDDDCGDNTTKLLQEHPFRSTKYIFEYMKKRFTHVQIFLGEDTRADDSKEL